MILEEVLRFHSEEGDGRLRSSVSKPTEITTVSHEAVDVMDSTHVRMQLSDFGQ
jgi:hypothetical protein